jgi:hypothetical protein
LIPGRQARLSDGVLLDYAALAQKERALIGERTRLGEDRECCADSSAHVNWRVADGSSDRCAM